MNRYKPRIATTSAFCPTCGCSRIHVLVDGSFICQICLMLGISWRHKS